MNKLLFFFFYAFFLLVVFSNFLSDLRLFYFAPFLVIAFYNQTKLKCLWLALFCGFIIDLLSSQTRIGFYALNYCLTTSILYNQKKHFFEESTPTIPMMTFLFVLLSTLIQVALLYIFGNHLKLSWEWFKEDLLQPPFYNAFYAGLAYTLPYLFFPKSGKKQTMLF